MEEPREITLEMLQCSDEVLDALEELQYKVEELQLFCEECAKKNDELLKTQIKNDKEYKQSLKRLNEEIINLRDTKMHILRENIMKECAVPPRWYNTLTKSVKQEKTIKDLSEKLNESKLELMEKEHIISSLQWKLKNSTASISVLNADRTRLAAEIDAMTLRIEEYECTDHFRRHNYDSGNHESASMYSNDDEVRSLSDKPSQVNSRGSYVGSDDDSSGVGTLKRAANFSNINALNESVDLNFASSTILSDPFTETSLQTTSTHLDSPDLKPERDDNENYMKNESTESNKYAKGSAISQSHCDWESFDTSGNNEKTTESCENLSEEVVTDNYENNDPWASPCTSPLHMPKFNRAEDPFWDSNENTAKLPFFVPKNDEDDEIFTNCDKNDVEKDQLEVPENNFRSAPKMESTPTKPLTNKSNKKGAKLPRNINFLDREKSNSWNADTRSKVKRNFLRKVESKDDLWDFEPDSIVDVSTGETIYESQCLHESIFDKSTQQATKADSSVIEGSATENEEKQSSQDDDLKCDDLCCEGNVKKKASYSTNNDQEKKESLNKATRPKLNISKSDNSSEKWSSSSSADRSREYIKKGPKKEREAFGAFVNWKTHGKQGKPPANLKVSLC